MESVLGDLRTLPVTHEHLARSLGFPDDLPLWLAEARNLPLTRSDLKQMGVFDIRSHLARVDDLGELMASADLGMMREETDTGEVNVYGILSIEVTPADSPVSALVITRADRTREYIIRGDMDSILRKQDFDKAMHYAWQALEVIRRNTRPGPGRREGTWLYKTPEELYDDLQRFKLTHRRMPKSKRDFMSFARISRDTLNSTLERFGITWEQALSARDDSK